MRSGTPCGCDMGRGEKAVAGQWDRVASQGGGKKPAQPSVAAGHMPAVREQSPDSALPTGNAHDLEWTNQEGLSRQGEVPRAHIHNHIHRPTHEHTHICAHMHQFTPTHTYTWTHTIMCTFIHNYTNVRAVTYIHTDVHIHNCTCTHTSTHITYMHTQISHAHA